MPRISIEERARRIIEREIGRAVVLHDDRSQPAMFDLLVGSADAPEIAIECTGAVDRVRAETWNIGPAKGPFQTSLDGDWHVQLRPNARVNRVRGRIESVLRRREREGVRGVTRVDVYLKLQDESLFDELDGLRIASIRCLRVAGEGVVHLGMSGVGGWVDSAGRALPGWIGAFLRSPKRARVLSKLRASGATECHAFIPVDFGGAPWLVESYLGDIAAETEAPLPSAAPDLPEPVTGVWITYDWRGVRWDGVRWRFFDATMPKTVDEVER